jgi:hypothetical protein
MTTTEWAGVKDARYYGTYRRKRTSRIDQSLFRHGKTEA